MRTIGKRILVLGMAVVMVGTLLTGCTKLKKEAVVATVGDSKITGDIANFYARYQQAQYETSYGSLLGDNMWEQEVSSGETYEDTMKVTILESLEQLYVLEDHMKDYEVTISDEEKTKIEDAAAKFIKANKADAKEAISADTKTVTRVLTLLTIQEKMYTAMTADVSTEVTDEEAAQKSMQYIAFDFNTTDENGATVEADDATKAEFKEKADAFLAGAKEAEDFAAYTTEAGYEVKPATFDKETTTPSPELIKAADALEEGALTEVVATDTAYYVAKVTSLLDRAATDTKKTGIVNQRKQDQYKSIYDGWKKDTKITEDKKNWKKISFIKEGIKVKEAAK